MRSASVGVLVLLVCGSAPAALIPYRQMDGLARASTDIVLCDEVACVEKKGKPSGDYVPTHYEYTLRVVRAMKGGCKPGDQLVVELDSLYSRRHMDTWPKPSEAPPIPLGRALFFLNREDGGWRPTIGGVKLLINGEVYCYGQFVSNPGGLWLARMAPENITISTTVAYDEGFLLVDLGAALEKAKGPPTPSGNNSRHWGIDGGIRRDYLPTPHPPEPPETAAAAPPGWTWPMIPLSADRSGFWIAAFGIALSLLVVLLINLPWKRRRTGP